MIYEKCVWKRGKESEYEVWRTKCGHIDMLEGMPLEHDYQYCPYCGHEIEIEEIE